MRLGDVAIIKRTIGALLLVPHWPSRRMIRRLQVENDELRELALLAVGSADAVCQRGKFLLNDR